MRLCGNSLSCNGTIFISAAVALENSDHRSAIDPVTNAVDKLVPLISVYCPPGIVLFIFIVGAINPRFPIDGPKFDAAFNLTIPSHPAT
jgi:hypothetical protein